MRRRVIDDYNEGRMTIDATVVIRIGDVEETEAARGVGVVQLWTWPAQGPAEILSVPGRGQGYRNLHSRQRRID